MNIYFSGIIGTGKTTLAKGLVERWGWQFDDLDQAIERTAGKTIAQVVEDEGWLRYRSLEYSICKGYARMQRAVIGLGGGTPRYEWNRDVLKGTGIVILLTADLNTLVPRVILHDRPVCAQWYDYGTGSGHYLGSVSGCLYELCGFDLPDGSGKNARSRSG